MRHDFELLYCDPVLACYDGDDGGSGDGGDGGGDDGGSGGKADFNAQLKQAENDAVAARAEADKKAAEVRQVAANAQAVKDTRFSQDDMNTFLAEDRRKHQEKYKKLETSFQDILADKNLAAEQRSKLEGELQDLQKAHRTKDQQAAYDLKQEQEKSATEVANYKEAATKWENMYKNSVIQRSLQDAAIEGEAFNPSQIVGLLTPTTEMRPATDDEGNEIPDQMVPKIDFPDIDEKTGNRITTLRTPQEAVQRMKELPQHFGNLFRANVVSGIGAGAATGGVTSGEGGKVDVTKLSSEQFRKLRKGNPEALGLRRKR